MKWYRSSGRNIEVIEIDKFTDSSVWVKHIHYNGKMESSRRAKVTDSESYWETFREAKNHFIKKYQEAYNSAQRNLEYRQEDLDKVIKIKEPK